MRAGTPLEVDVDVLLAREAQQLLDAFLASDAGLFVAAEGRAEEERFLKKTGIFPIMHLMTMRRTVFEQHPWIAMNLFKMFDEAKRRCFNRLRDFTCARIPLPWAAAIADEIAVR